MVSPEPIRYFLGKEGHSGRLYDRLVVISGSPGSGKTTLARVFDYPSITALLRNRTITGYREMVATLEECRAISDQRPLLLGCRLPLEVDYRDFWDFPYPDELKVGLMTALIQARAVMAWLRHLTSAQIPLRRICITPRQGTEAAVDAIGGTDGEGLLKRAKSVEAAIYQVIGALVAPPVSQLQRESTDAYRPFDVIERFGIFDRESDHHETDAFLPLVILDDAHALHPGQYRALHRWLARRELRVARWLLTRFDVMHAPEALATITQEHLDRVDLPGITTTRDFIEILLQSNLSERREQRLTFRKMAKDMANRYLRQMPLFSSRNLTTLADLLSTTPEEISPSKQKELQAQVATTQRKLSISSTRRDAIDAEVSKYEPTGKRITDDVRLGMISVLMNRYAKRTPGRSLFEADADPEPAKPLNADIAVFDAASMHLLHKYDRPYYFGIDDLCDASSENAEQFLHLAATLVETSAVQIIRAKSPSLDAETQHKLLRQTADKVIREWDFPECDRVKSLARMIVDKCLTTTLLPNAPLGAGANAYGILQEDFDTLPEKHPDLARVLQFGVAYNAFTLIPRYPCKKQTWCLLELGGMVLLANGLTLKRGGFIEGGAKELADSVGRQAR